MAVKSGAGCCGCAVRTRVWQHYSRGALVTQHAPQPRQGLFSSSFLLFFFFFSLVEEEKVTQYSDSGLRINREPPYVTQGAGGAGADCHSCTAPLWPSSMRWPPGHCNPDLSAGAHL